MSQSVCEPMKTFTVSGALGVNLRVKMTSGVLALAGANDYDLGTMLFATFAGATVGTVLLRNADGTAKMVASEAIAKGADVFAAASGKVGASGAVRIGTALEAASADGDVIEVLRMAAPPGVQSINPAASEVTGNTILAGSTAVDVGAVTVDANDWIVLPPIASVPIGYTIRIAANAGANFEMRTPAGSNTKINDVDADGTQEYLCTDTDLIIVTKRTTTGWVAQSLTKLGAVRTAVIPD